MLFPEFQSVELAPGAQLLRGAAEACATELLSEIQAVITVSPLLTVATPMGKSMSVEMTNCGDVGWVSDRTGYRYETIDPVTNSAWPAMPSLFAELASRTAAQAGFPDFHPDACLINRYAAGSKMGLHQDRDEQDFTQPLCRFHLDCRSTSSSVAAHEVVPPQRLNCVTVTLWCLVGCPGWHFMAWELCAVGNTLLLARIGLI